MDKLKKLVFLELTNKQLFKSPNQEYMNLYSSLTPEEKKEWIPIQREIHDIWNAINSKAIDFIPSTQVNSVSEYNERFGPINELIFQVSEDFNLNLRDEISEDFKDAIRHFFGDDYLNDFLSE